MMQAQKGEVTGKLIKEKVNSGPLGSWSIHLPLHRALDTAAVSKHLINKQNKGTMFVFV